MSKSNKSKSSAASKQLIDNFCNFTKTSKETAKLFIDKYRSLEVAVDAYYTDPHEFRGHTSKRADTDRNAKLTALYEKYKAEDPGSDTIALNGTIKLCEDLGVDPQDVVLLALAYELKSSEMCVWEKQGWMDGWRDLGCDSVESMKTALRDINTKLASDPAYFNAVYAKTFTFGLQPNQRHLSLDMAIGFWSLLLPHALAGGALLSAGEDDMDEDRAGGWTTDCTTWWFDFLTEKGLKGISKDIWSQFLVFVRSIDAKFENYNEEESWPTVIDEFVERARERVKALT